VAVNEDGKREVLGVATGSSETETFWTGFLRSLAARGLRGVKLVIAPSRQIWRNKMSAGRWTTTGACGPRLDGCSTPPTKGAEFTGCEMHWHTPRPSSALR